LAQPPHKPQVPPKSTRRAMAPEPGAGPRTAVAEFGPAHLGKESRAPQAYAPEVLEPIPRALGSSRQRRGPPHGVGVDIWNAYELMWLDGDEVVRTACLEIRIGSSSTHLIESKSLKLYLFSFASERFDSTDLLLQRISGDLTPLLGSPPGLLLDPHRPAREASQFDVVLPLVRSKDGEKVSLAAAVKGADALDVFVSVLGPGFMSLCPVTGQPDYADVELIYEGKDLDWKAVGAYLGSFWSHHGFHEDCSEQLLGDFLEACSPKSLQVALRYTRRGGLDINPVRAVGREMDDANYRFSRQ